MTTKTNTPDPIIETKSVKHTFTPEERNTLGSDLARAIAALRGTEAEFDQVKASYKARTTESEARIDNLSTALMNGFDMRNERCIVVFRPADKLKDYYLESDFPKGPAVLTEPMTQDDFQADLIRAESKFDKRDEIPLFVPVNDDEGTLVVGRFADKWFSALRIKIGKLTLHEQLDTEQRAFKKRCDAVSHAVNRASKWSKENLKDLSKGFEASFSAVADEHKERVE